MHDPVSGDQSGSTVTTAGNEESSKLLSTETLFRVLEEMPIGVYIADKEGQIIYGNSEVKKIWSGMRYVGPDDFCEYKGWWLDSGERITSEQWALSRAIKQSEQSQDEEIIIECFDGSRKIIRNSAFPLLDEEQNVTGAFALNQDITAQKSYIGEIEHLAAFPSNNPNPVLQISSRGALLYHNPGSERFLSDLGYAEGTKINDELCDIVKETLANGKSRQTDMQIADRYYSLTFTPVREKEYVNVYGMDITARWLAQHALHKYNKLESLRHLAAGIAHDFNNLLAGIYGCIDLAQSECPAVDCSYLDTALTTMDRARTITQQLITFTRGGEPDLREDDIVSCIRTGASLAMEGTTAIVKYSGEERSYQCRFDTVQIDQVIRNIVQNALQAMPDGGGIITIAFDTITLLQHSGTLSEGRYVKISVSDQGEGIAPDVIDQIFDPFFTTRGVGRGLGLTTSISIVTRHHGTIEVESRQGNGSTFHIYLPAMTSPHSDSAG